MKRGFGSKEPLRVIKHSNVANISMPAHDRGLNSPLDIIRVRFNDKNQSVVSKEPNNLYLAFKQKRYAVRKKFAVKKKYTHNIANDQGPVTSNKAKLRLRVLLKNSCFDAISGPTATRDYKFFKKGKKFNDNLPVPLARRILRTRRTLVLPAHVNITAITNSYDVVHSWFIPSLGLKLDCVPGRSTHHVIYIDSVGFYYGQCAEICGRYHHHMPIRVCALPFEHFLLWWHSYGAPKFLFTKSSKKANAYYSNSKYTW